MPTTRRSRRRSRSFSSSICSPPSSSPRSARCSAFSTTNGEAFGIFAGTAINDTSSVTAAASTWDSLYGLGSQTLDKAVTVKLTRTLAIIPITLVLAFVRTKRAKTDGTKVDLKKIFPMFILYFLLASVITTVCVSVGVSASVFAPLKTLSKFLIVMAMCAVGLNTNIVKLVKTGGKPLIMGFLLLGRHRGHEPADAARARHLVKHEQKTGGSRSYPAAALRLSKSIDFAVCCAHNLSAAGAQIPHLHPLSSIFSAAHVAGENDLTFFRHCGGETLRGF